MNDLHIDGALLAQFIRDDIKDNKRIGACESVAVVGVYQGFVVEMHLVVQDEYEDDNGDIEICPQLKHVMTVTQ